MVLSDVNRIDIVSEDPSGEVVLSIVAPEPWTDTQRALEQLTDKLYAYLTYMHSDDFQAKFGEASASIQLVAADEPPQQVKKLLDATAKAAKIRIGIERVPSMRMESESVVRAPNAKPVVREQQVASAVLKSGALSSKRAVQTVFGALGVLGGLGGAIYAFSRSSSFALAIYVFVVVNYVIARGVADAVTDPYKIRRLLYFALMPALSTGLLYLAYRQWDKMWLAVVLGLAGGLVLNGILAPIIFPRIHREEGEDSLERVKEAIERRAKT
jgi:hypothetical protein